MERSEAEQNARVIAQYPARNGERELAVTAVPTGKLKLLEETGTEGLRAFYGHTTEPYIDKLRWPGAYDIYNEMRRREPTLRTVLNCIRLLSRQAEWKVEAASDKDTEAAEFLESCLEDMSHTVSDFVDDALTFLPFGWSSFELCYKRRQGADSKHKSRYTDGKIGWRKFAFRRQSSWDRWQFDEEGGLAGWWQQAAPDYKDIFLPIEKLLHLTGERDGGNPEGLSLFESAYEPYHFITNLQIIAGIGWQRTFVGLPVFKFEQKPSPDDLAQVAATGKALTVDEKQWASVPPGVTMELASTNNTGAGALLETIRHFRILMTQMVLADFVFLGTEGTGSWSLGQDKSALFLMAVNGYLDRIEAAWNRYAVARLFDYNEFPGLEELPQITHSVIRKPNLPELGQFLQAIGALIPLGDDDAGWIRQQAGMPEAPEPEAEEAPKPETGGEEEETDEMAEFAEAEDPRRTVEAAVERQIRAFLRDQADRVEQMAAQGASLLDDAFWSQEHEAFRQEMLTQLLRHTNGLAQKAIEDLTRQFGAGADWALVNADASRWAREYVGQLITKVNDTTKESVRQTVQTWIETKAELPELRRALTPTFGRQRAELIAVTEVTRAYDEANDMVRQRLGMPATAFKAPAHPACRCFTRPKLLPSGEWVVIWQTVRDKTVCQRPFDTPWGVVNGCADLHHVVVSEGDNLGKRVEEL